MDGLKFFACLLVKCSDLIFVLRVKIAGELIFTVCETDISIGISNFNEHIAFSFGECVFVEFHTIKVGGSEFDFGKTGKQIHFHSIKAVLKRWFNGKKLGFEGLVFFSIGSSKALSNGFKGSRLLEILDDFIHQKIPPIFLGFCFANLIQPCHDFFNIGIPSQGRII